jgi:hypothetical protein
VVDHQDDFFSIHHLIPNGDVLAATDGSLEIVYNDFRDNTHKILVKMYLGKAKYYKGKQWWSRDILKVVHMAGQTKASFSELNHAIDMMKDFSKSNQDALKGVLHGIVYQSEILDESYDAGGKFVQEKPAKGKMLNPQMKNVRLLFKLKQHPAATITAAAAQPDQENGVQGNKVDIADNHYQFVQPNDIDARDADDPTCATD